jgi:hypothetical protein
VGVRGKKKKDLLRNLTSRSPDRETIRAVDMGVMEGPVPEFDMMVWYMATL